MCKQKCVSEQAIETIALLFNALDCKKKGMVELSEVEKKKDDLGELAKSIVKRGLGRYDRERAGCLNMEQFIQVFPCIRKLTEEFPII